jgi:glycosyltransferase involved in cell wall biosynthesis
MVTALAVVCVRNEAIHIRRCLADFINSGIDVVLIDNESTDGTLEIAREFLGSGLLAIESLAWRGAFSLTDQIAAKKRQYERYRHDWVIHADADEWLCSDRQDQSLYEGILDAELAGASCINFLEMVFIPRRNENFFVENYRELMCDYYFFQPSYPRLMRAWKRELKLDNSASGGHRLAGKEINFFNRDFILRHYIVLSMDHAKQKYINRKFSAEDLAKNWHRNRTLISQENIEYRRIPEICTLSYPRSKQFDLRKPVRTHFWQW